MPETIPTFTARRWTPLEVSLVNIGADPKARIRSEDLNMSTRTATAEPTTPDTPSEPTSPATAAADAVRQAQQDTAQLYRDATFLRIPHEAVNAMIEGGMAPDRIRLRMLELAAERDAEDQIVATIRGGHSGEDPEFRARQCVDALAHRLSGGRIELPESAQPVRGMGLMQMHAYVGDLRQRAHAGSWLSRANIGAAHTTSDYPVLLLEGAANRVLGELFTVMASPLRQVARVITVPDFRQITRVRRGEAPKLLEVNEHGEVTHGTVGEEFERYVVKTYARNYSLTRNAIINDDLNAFSDFLSDMARSAAITEAGVLVDLITAGGNGVTLSDGTALFHQNHGNVATTGAAPDVDTLGEARAAMRLQKSPTNEEPLNLTPRYIVGPAALETTIDKLLAEITANTIDSVNPFSGRLIPLIEPRLDAISAAAWYVVADPGVMPFLEVATLDGNRPMATSGAPQVRTFEGEDVLGLKYQAVHDFGAFPVNYRAAFKNAGE